MTKRPSFLERIAQAQVNYVKLTLIIALLFMYVVAAALGIRLLFFICGTLLSLFAVSYVLTRVALKELRCTSHVPQTMTEGQRDVVAYTVLNKGRMPSFFLRLDTDFPVWVQPVGNGDKPFLLALWPGEDVDLSLPIVAVKRGRHRVGKLLVRSRDPLGLSSATLPVGDETEVLVYPQVFPLQRLGFASEGAVSYHPLQSTAVAADGVEFHGLREYVPGDELRRIHWKSTAHRGRFTVIEFEESFSSDLALLLDLDSAVHAGEGKEASVEYVVRIAASITSFLLARGNAARVIAYSRGSLVDTDFQWGTTGLHRLLSCLAEVEADSDATLEHVAREATAALVPSSAVLVLSTTWAFTLPAAVRSLRQRPVNVVSLLLDAASFAGGPLRDRPPARAAAGFQVPGTTVRIVRRGDDLARALELPAQGFPASSV